jgi:GH25 family lysozyme M1 (1,4-beta-N-acetylmuramidase)
MSITAPIWGTDISNHNPKTTLIPRMAAQNYAYSFVLAGQGAWFKNDLYRRQQKQLAENDMIRGAYYFLSGEASGAAQANHFLNIIGDTSDLMIAIDFERYSPPPTNAILRDCIATLRRQVGSNKPLIVYSGPGFWFNPPSSGPLADYGDNLIAWNASYLVDNTGFGENHQRNMKQWYSSVINWQGYEHVYDWQWDQHFAAKEKTWWQQLGQAYIDDTWVDANAFRGSIERLKSFA